MYSFKCLTSVIGFLPRVLQVGFEINDNPKEIQTLNSQVYQLRLFPKAEPYQIPFNIPVLERNIFQEAYVIDSEAIT